MRTLLLCSILAVAAAGQTQAATHNFQQAYQISDGATGERINELDNFVSINGDVERTRSASVPNASATSTFSIDRADGFVKLGAKVEHDTGVGSQFATTRLDVREIFTATGTGTATFRFDLDGLLFAQDAASAVFQADMRMARWMGPSVPGQLTVETEYSAAISVLETIGTVRRTINGTTFDESLSAGGPAAGELAVNEVLELSYNVRDGSSFTVEIGAFLRASLGNPGGIADADFLSTGYLSYETTDGLSLTTSDPLFMSGTTGRPNTGDPTVAPVPLPASAVYLLAALGGLGLLRRKSTA